MFGLYNTGKVPFEAVYLHGLILDEKGQKMSKSKGNVIDPMSQVDTYGSDAFRMGIIQGQTAGHNQPFNTAKLVAGRNFANKLWNIARFVEDKVGDDYHNRQPDPQTPADYYILSKLQQLTDGLTDFLDTYRFSEAYEALYHFVWDEFADWYVEASKAALNKSVLAYLLEVVLKLTHPFAPFVTETIWQTLKWEGDSLLAVSEWPHASKVDSKPAKIFEEIKTIVSEIRYIRSMLGVRDLQLYYTNEPFLKEHAQEIKSLARLEDVKEVRDGQGLNLTQTKYRSWLDLDHDSIKHFLHDLQLKIAEHEQSIVRLEGRLSNKSYIEHAPKELVEETIAQLAEVTALKDKAVQEYDRFSSNKKN